ncbi:MAG: cysteine desulfurase [Promethearchaeota archaeon]|nr:MAG: cysteine desulfurase [Candidatus Lokiarchaeota archaeon]
MSKERREFIYLDHAATTPLDPRVLDEMLPYLQNHFGNASSMHALGQFARETIELSRARIAKCLGANPREIIFTGSGTEADNIAIIGTAMKLRKFGKHVITTRIEHPAVRNSFRKLQNEGFDVSYLSVNTDGQISLKELRETIRDDTILVSVMYANNEIGSIQPIREIADITSQHQIIFHTDAVQAVGKLRINLQEEKIDLLSASAHKIYGPKGMGFLYIRNQGRIPQRQRGVFIIPITYGGGQEFGFRSATENVAGIVGCAKAVELRYSEMSETTVRLQSLRDDLISWILENIPGSSLNGGWKHRLANNINVGFTGISGTDLLEKLNDEKIAVSVGSACHSKSQDVSFVLTAIGLPEKQAESAIRITLGKETTGVQLGLVKDVLRRSVNELRIN